MTNYISIHTRDKLKMSSMFYLADLFEHFTHALTLQTKLKTYNASAARMEHQVQQAQQSIHYLRMRLNRTLYGNGSRRNPNLVPIFIPVLEGSTNNYDHNKTLHYHVGIGNLPNNCSTEMLTDAVTQIWSSSSAGTSDVLVQEMNARTPYNFSKYIVKEFDDNNIDVIDYPNAQLPQYLLN